MIKNIFLFLLLSYFACCKFLQAEGTQLNIAVITDLSGAGAGYSESLTNGIKMAMSDLPESDRQNLIFHYEDDQLIAKNTVAAFQKLSSMHKLDSVITFSSGTSNAVVALTERAEVPLLALATDAAISKNKKYAFNFWVTPETVTKLLFSEIKLRAYNKIARISTTHNGAFAINAAFDQLNKGQIEIAIDENYTVDVKDFKTYLTKLKHIEDLDAIFINLLPGQIGIFAKQVREFGISIPLFDVELFEDENEVKNSNGALIGQWYVTADELESNLLKRYRAEFPNSTTYATASGYDLVMHFNNAYKQKLRGKDIAKYFQTLKNYSGALGEYSATGDNRFSMSAAVKIVEQDGFRKLR